MLRWRPRHDSVCWPRSRNWDTCRITRARSLRNRRTYTIAGAIPDITNPFYPAFERGIQDVASAAGYDLLVFNTDGVLEMERKFLASARSGRVDGVIVRFFQAPLAECLPLVRGGVPVVALTSEPPPSGDIPIDTVAIDGAGAAQGGRPPISLAKGIVALRC